MIEQEVSRECPGSRTVTQIHYTLLGAAAYIPTVNVNMSLNLTLHAVLKVEMIGCLSLFGKDLQLYRNIYIYIYLGLHAISR